MVAFPRTIPMLIACFGLVVWGCAGARSRAGAGTPGESELCGPVIPGLDGVSESPLIVLGELHGMAAPPAFAADLACRIAANGRPVLLALEIPKQEQARLDEFLNAPGEPRLSSLLAGEFWQRSFQDGRASHARLAMLETIGSLVQQGLPIRIVGFDDTSVQAQQPRERAMAENILAARAPGETTIVLVGNLHARTVAGAPWDPTIVWMSVSLHQQEPRLLTLDNRYLDGNAWTCTSAQADGCGVHAVRGRGKGETWGIERYAEIDADGYHGVFQLGTAVVSSPAKELLRP